MILLLLRLQRQLGRPIAGREGGADCIRGAAMGEEVRLCGLWVCPDGGDATGDRCLGSAGFWFWCVFQA